MVYVAIATADLKNGQIAVMGDAVDGFRSVPGYMTRPLEEAEDLARKLNEKIGIAQAEVLSVLLSSLQVCEQGRRALEMTRKHGGRA